MGSYTSSLEDGSSNNSMLADTKSKYGARLDLLGILGVVQYIGTHHRNVESLFTHVESSVDYASQIDPYALHDMRTAISNGDPRELNKLLPECSPYLVAAALKMHFKEMEEPIVPFRYYEDFLAAGKRLANATDDQKVAEYRRLLDQLPTVPHGTLEKLIRLLDILESGESPYILACAFASSVLRPKQTPESTIRMVEDPKVILRVLHFMVGKAKRLFPRPGDPKQSKKKQQQHQQQPLPPPPPPPSSKKVMTAVPPSIKPSKPKQQSPSTLQPKQQHYTGKRAEGRGGGGGGGGGGGEKTKSGGEEGNGRRPKFPALKKRQKKFGTLTPGENSIQRLQAYTMRARMNNSVKRLSSSQGKNDSNSLQNAVSRLRKTGIRKAPEKKVAATAFPSSSKTANNSHTTVGASRAASNKPQHDDPGKEKKKRVMKKEAATAITTTKETKSPVKKPTMTTTSEATMGSKNNQQQRQPQGAKKKNRKALVSMWDEKAKKAAAQQKRNVFSKDYDSSTHAKGKNKPGQKGYGKAPEGSKSAARAAKAKLWVKQQIGQLISVIKKIGSQSSQGRYEVTFGIIFVAYQDISDTLVGILRRARKYGCVEFEGDMLFQGQSDNVIISLTAKADTWKHMPPAK